MLLPDFQIRALCNPATLPLQDDGVDRPRLPMIDNFSEGVQDGGVVSYGLSHAGYDLRIGLNEVRIFKNTFNEVISPKRMKTDEAYLAKVFDFILDLKQGQPIIIPPNKYILCYSLEYLRIPRLIKGRCVGKSTYARCAVLVNTTPAEPGWEGHLTIEVANVCDAPVEVYAGEGIAQMEFEMLAAEPQVDYAQKQGKYNKQGPVPVAAKVWQPAF